MRLAAAWPVSAAISADARRGWLLPIAREEGGLSDDTFDASGVLLRLLMAPERLSMVGTVRVDKLGGEVLCIERPEKGL